MCYPSLRSGWPQLPSQIPRLMIFRTKSQASPKIPFEGSRGKGGKLKACKEFLFHCHRGAMKRNGSRQVACALHNFRTITIFPNIWVARNITINQLE